MGRHPIGNRPMTVTERHRKWLAAKVANASKPVAVPAPPLAPDVPPLGSYIAFKQARDYPKWAALELYDGIGRDATVALRDALTWVIAKKGG